MVFVKENAMRNLCCYDSFIEKCNELSNLSKGNMEKSDATIA